jgi:restriction system protein
VYSAPETPLEAWLLTLAIGAGVVLLEHLRRWGVRHQAREAVRRRWRSLQGSLADAIVCHQEALERRLLQLAWRDAYGGWVLDRWPRELQHFVDYHVKPRLGPVSEAESAQLFEWLRNWATALDMEELQETCLEQPRRNDGQDFERLVASKLSRAGFSVTLTPASGDQGVDLLASKGGRLIAFQCKDYSGAVGNAAVQEVFAGSRFYGADAAAIVTRSDYTAPARQLATSLGVACLHLGQLELWLDEEALRGLLPT